MHAHLHLVLLRAEEQRKSAIWMPDSVHFGKKSPDFLFIINARIVSPCSTSAFISPKYRRIQAISSAYVQTQVVSCISLNLLAFLWMKNPCDAPVWIITTSPPLSNLTPGSTIETNSRTGSLPSQPKETNITMRSIFSQTMCCYLDPKHGASQIRFGMIKQSQR